MTKIYSYKSTIIIFMGARLNDFVGQVTSKRACEFFRIPLK